MNIIEISKGVANEFQGTFWITLVIGWAELEMRYQTYQLFSLAFTTLFIVAVWSWVGMQFSTSNYNPVITCVLLLSKRISKVKAISFMVAQLVGAILGIVILRELMPTQDKSANYDRFCYGCAFIKDDYQGLTAVLAEFISGFMLIYAYYASVIDKRAPKDFYALFIGGAYALCTIVFGSRMTVFMNPFRYLAGAIYNNTYRYFYVYLPCVFFGAFYASWIFDKRIMVDQPKVAAQEVRFED